MSENFDLIENAISIIEKHIETIKERNYEKFVSLFTPRIAEMINQELFEKVLELYEKVPLSVNAIDKEGSQIISENNVKLIMVRESNRRPLCNVIKLGDEWLIDQIYWKTE